MGWGGGGKEGGGGGEGPGDSVGWGVLGGVGWGFMGIKVFVVRESITRFQEDDLI